MKDRLSIDKTINENVISQIDETKLLDLDKTSSERIELFIFAMTLGIKTGKRTPLSNLHGFVLEKSIHGEQMSYMVSILIDELRKTNEEEKIDNKDLVFTIAEEYANTGFHIIEAWLGIEEENTVYSLIDEMDEKYEQIFRTL